MSSVLDRPELSSSGKKYDLIFAIYDYHRKDNEQWFSYTQHTDEKRRYWCHKSPNFCNQLLHITHVGNRYSQSFIFSFFTNYLYQFLYLLLVCWLGCACPQVVDVISRTLQTFQMMIMCTVQNSSKKPKSNI